MLSSLVTALSVGLTIPVLVSSYYSLILLLSSLKYPKAFKLENETALTPRVSVLIAVYNERFVIGQTLDALKELDYPKDRLQVVVADDSNDDTIETVDEKVQELNLQGIVAAVSRRVGRDAFKSGALNKAALLLDGDLVLLLDADSTVRPEVLRRGVAMFAANPDLAFVSYRVGHYNREQSLLTSLFALSVDLGDTLTKMGAYAINSPFSFQGGYTLLSMTSLREVGFWSNNTVVDDADLSCKIYASGRKGIYLSDTRIYGEDPQSLEVWKKQAARVSQGWGKCIVLHGPKIIGSKTLSLWRRLALLLFLAGPFSSLSWLIVSFLSGIAIILGVSSPSSSIFNSPAYTLLLTIPLISYFAAAAYSLHVQGIMTGRNLALVPLISYTGYSMITATSVGFLSGIAGRTGYFFRTPKSGPVLELNRTGYFHNIGFDRISIVEAILAVSALTISVVVMFRGVWFLGLSLIGFGILTLKSMRLSRLFEK